MAVVDLVEPVEVDEQDAEGVAVGVAEHPVQVLGEEGAVGEPGERVVGGLVAQQAVDLVAVGQLRGHRPDHDARDDRDDQEPLEGDRPGAVGAPGPRPEFGRGGHVGGQRDDEPGGSGQAGPEAHPGPDERDEDEVGQQRRRLALERDEGERGRGQHERRQHDELPGSPRLRRALQADEHERRDDEDAEAVGQDPRRPGSGPRLVVVERRPDGAERAPPPQAPRAARRRGR